MGFIANYKSIFEDILSLVLQNRFADIEQLSDLQNEALFGMIQRTSSPFYRLATENRSYSSKIFAENYF